MTNYNSISNEQITNQLVKVFGNPSTMEDYNRPSAGSMWDMFAGWCGSMSPANRAAFVEAFGLDRVNECEQEARQSIENNEIYYKCSFHHRHTVHAEMRETLINYTPRVNDFVFAVYSGLKCDDGRGIYGEIESALNYADEKRTNIKNLCHVSQVYEVSNAEFLNEHLADEIVHNHTQNGDRFPGGYSTDDPDAHDLLDEYRYYFTETAAVVNRDNGKWFLIDSEGYDYPRYCLMPTNWREMYADEVAAATERENARKAEEASKAEEEKNARFAAYMERCAKWEPIMTDCRPLVEAYNKTGHRTPEEKTAQRKLNDARRNNIAAMVRAAFPGLKFRVHKNSGWGAEYTIEYTDGPTLEEFNNAVDYDLFARTTDEFDGMTDYAYTKKKEFTAFADKYMCMDFGGEVKAERDHSPEHRAQMVAQFAEALPDVSMSERHKYTVDEYKALAAAWGLDWIDLSNIALDCYGSNPDGELLLYAVFCRMNLYTRPEDTTPTDPKPGKKSSTDTTPDTDEAPAEGLALVEISDGVAVVGDSRATYRNRKAIKAHGAKWNKEAQQWQATDPEAVAALRAWFGMNDEPTPDPTEQKTDSKNTDTPTGQKCPAPLITTSDTNDPEAMREAAENVREWCITDQLADPTPYAAEFDNVAALAWAVLNNYTPTEAEQMTAAALQLAAKMQRRANEINKATAAMEETNRQEYEPEQWKANREEIEQFESYAEELAMYADGLAVSVGVPDWQLWDVADIPEPQDDPAQLTMNMEIPEAPAPAPDVLQTLPAKNYQLNEKYIAYIAQIRKEYGSQDTEELAKRRLNDQAADAPAILYGLLKCRPDATVKQAHDVLEWENFHTLCWHPEVIEDIMRRMLFPLSPKTTDAAPVTDAEVYEQAARIRATYEALKAEAETETPAPSQSKSDNPRSQKSHRLPAVKERKPRAKHSALCRSMLKNMNRGDKDYLIKYGVNLADPSLTVCAKPNNQSTTRILREAKKDGYSIVLVAIHPSFNSYSSEYAYPTEGDKWESSTTKGGFEEYRRDSNTKLYLVKSKTCTPRSKEPRHRRDYGDQFERLGRPGHDPWMKIGVDIDKSGYRLVNLESRKQEAHRYWSAVRRQQAEEAFNTADRDEAIKKAQSIVDDLRIMFADFILNGGNPHDASWEFEKCTDKIEGYFSMKRAETDEELQEYVEEFNEAVEKFKKKIQPEEEEAAAKAA